MLYHNSLQGETNIAVVGYSNNHVHGGLQMTDPTANGTEVTYDAISRNIITMLRYNHCLAFIPLAGCNLFVGIVRTYQSDVFSHS